MINRTPLHSVQAWFSPLINTSKMRRPSFTQPYNYYVKNVDFI